MKFKWIYTLPFLMGFSLSCFAEGLSVLSVRDKVFIEKENSESILAKARASISFGDKMVLGSKGGITLSGARGLKLSAIGPALFSVEKLGKVGIRFRLEYGDVYLKASSAYPVTLSTPGFDVKDQGDGFDFYYETAPNSGVYRLRNRGHKLKVLDEKIDRGMTLHGTHEGHWLAKSDSADIDSVFARHKNNEENKDLLAATEKPYDPDAVDSLPGFFEIGFFLGTAKFLPEASSLGQYTTVMGANTKVGFHFYPHLPLEPQRVDFIYASAFRFGVDLGMISGVIHWGSVSTYRPKFIFGNIFVGVETYGFSLDVFAGRPFFVGSLGGAELRAASGFAYGAEAGFRLDLKYFMESETGLFLGLRAMKFPLETTSNALKVGAGLPDTYLTFIPIIPVASISMKF